MSRLNKGAFSSFLTGLGPVIHEMFLLFLVDGRTKSGHERILEHF